MSDDWEQKSLSQVIDQDEVAKFSELAGKWWDSSGPMAPLHKMNPLRLTWIRDQISVLTKQPAPRLRPLDGLRLLDLGCGAGLAAEPMAMMGASVTAIDPSRDSIEAARQHAQKRGARIDYRAMPIEDLVGEGPLFDGVTLLEVIEHVPDQQAFIDLTAALVRPGGILVVSTISRTAGAYIKAIVAAEYLLGWLPRGTHEWRKFVKPSKMSHMLRRAGLTPVAITGIDYDASRDQFRLCRDPSVNYMMSARKA